MSAVLMRWSNARDGFLGQCEESPSTHVLLYDVDLYWLLLIGELYVHCEDMHILVPLHNPVTNKTCYIYYQERIHFISFWMCCLDFIHFQRC